MSLHNIHKTSNLIIVVCSCPVEELGLDFTLPGYPNIELRKGGREMTVSHLSQHVVKAEYHAMFQVNLENLASYVSLVSHWLLVEGVSTQMEAVRYLDLPCTLAP